MTAMLVETGLVTSTRLADGLLVQLMGDLGAHHVAELRDTLLGPLPSECRDVVVDAGEVTDVDFDALAIVFAAWAWAEDQGARFLLSRTSPQFEAALEFHGVADALPRLSELAQAPMAPVIPLQRGTGH
jgi:anti-anti-sigma regulatory factor